MMLPMVLPVRVALLGNSFARSVQLPALAWAGQGVAGGVEVVGLAGRDPARAAATAREFAIPFATGDWRELLALDPDLWIVTTPVDLHAPMVDALLGTRGAILCEKPFTLDAAEALPLVERGVERGVERLCLLDHQLRWSPWRRALARELAAGAVGRPRHARVHMHLGSPARLAAPWSWWYDASRGGGVLMALGSHLIDLLERDLGPVRRVAAHLTRWRDERQDEAGRPRPVTADEHARLWLQLEDGIEVSLETSLVEPAGTGSRIEVVGEEGTLLLEEETCLRHAPHGEAWREVPVDGSAVPTVEELGMGSGGIFARVLPLYLRDVLGAVARGESTLRGAATFADGLRTMLVLDAARRAAREGRWVEVP